VTLSLLFECVPLSHSRFDDFRSNRVHREVWSFYTRPDEREREEGREEEGREEEGREEEGRSRSSAMTNVGVHSTLNKNM